MNLQDKVEKVAALAASIATHDDEPEAEVRAALDAASKSITTAAQSLSGGRDERKTIAFNRKAELAAARDREKQTITADDVGTIDASKV